MKNFFCPRCKGSRTVGEHPYDHTWLTCYKCNYGFPYEQAICPEFDEAKPEESSEKILTWAKADVEFKEEWQLFWPVGFITLCSTEEKYAKIEAAMFIYLFCTGVLASLAIHLNTAYADMIKRYDQGNLSGACIH